MTLTSEVELGNLAKNNHNMFFKVLRCSHYLFTQYSPWGSVEWRFTQVVDEASCSRTQWLSAVSGVGDLNRQIVHDLMTCSKWMNYYQSFHFYSRNIEWVFSYFFCPFSPVPLREVRCPVPRVLSAVSSGLPSSLWGGVALSLCVRGACVGAERCGLPLALVCLVNSGRSQWYF